MNTQLSAPPGRSHPPQPVTRTVRRVGLVDRLALHVGVALVAWSRRPRVDRYSRDELVRMLENRVAAEKRRRDEDLRRLLVGSSWRA